jgi:hypothetical protein
MAMAIAMGIVLGIAYTLSPLSVLFIPAAAGLLWWAGRGASPRERRWIIGIVLAAIAVRVALIAGVFLFGSPVIDRSPINVLFGDEEYMISRALRQRALWLGASMTTEAFRDLYEQYGRTSYMDVLVVAQVVFGPSPYGVRLLSVLMYVAGGIILHRIVRLAFGRVVALGSLTFLLFLPSLVMWSSAALKESLNFLLATAMLGTAVATVRARWRWRPVALAGLVMSLAWLATLRDGAAIIAGAGLAAAIAIVLGTGRAWRVACLALAIVATLAVVDRVPPVEAAAMSAVRAAAMRHRGHVYTPGHSYLLMDPSFYGGPRSLLFMNHEEALRFIGRGVLSTLLYPMPWQMRSRSELVYLPEQIIWYLVVVLAPVGFVVGLWRDRLTTALLGGYSAVVLVAVGVNSGNMGTLVRHRALAVPYLGVFAVLGAAYLFTHWNSERGIHATD